jgi:hypothetical protein
MGAAGGALNVQLRSRQFFIPHSPFDIPHFGFRKATETEMKNVE